LGRNTYHESDHEMNEKLNPYQGVCVTKNRTLKQVNRFKNFWRARSSHTFKSK